MMQLWCSYSSDRQERGLGKEELLGMIRFGADAIFHASSEGGTTEEDLDQVGSG